MRIDVLILAIVLPAGAPAVAGGQAAHVGRLPVLELPPTGVGSWRNDPVTAEIRHGGIARLVSFQASDSSSHRLVSLGMNASGGLVMLIAMMGTDQGRRGESESVNVFFGTGGAIVRGRRSAFTTGTPARLSDDRQLGLLPGDTLAIRRLASALRQRCRI